MATRRQHRRADEDKVRFFGVEHYFTWHPAYDAVEAYVAERAPERLPELRGHFDLIAPTADNVFAHIDEYTQVEDKQPFIDHARQLHDLVATVSHAPGDLTHELTAHAARQIVSFYEHFSLLDLRIRAPRPVRDWLGSPLTRGLADRPGSAMSDGSLVRWYDLVVHRQEVSPVATNGR